MTASAFESLTGAVDLDFPEYARPPAEPIGLVRTWLRSATEREVREPRALALATADERGRASNRIVAILDVTDRGLTFASHTCSRKGSELAATGWASGLLYWRETGQQVVLSGPTRMMPETRSDELWYGRPIPLHAMSAASRQSEPLGDPVALLDEAERLSTGVALPRPDRFVGYELVAESVEFWCASSDRLHRRLRYERAEGGGWTVARLQP